MAKKPKVSPGSIAQNKRARFEYQLHDKLEAGIVLAGWEVKSIREGRCQLTESFVIFHKGEAFLHNCTITPLKTALAHIVAEPQRPRKLLLHKRELARLINAVQAKGQACVATAMYWKGNKVKVTIALGTGKKLHDKRAASKERDWNRDKSRVMKAHNQ
ncbi:MAG: SsrA-binding protein SmpB [Pseudomonadales bacterium]|nr:SsrA-binding protein SmpB [Pseudomonadales bacterium]